MEKKKGGKRKIIIIGFFIAFIGVVMFGIIEVVQNPEKYQTKDEVSENLIFDAMRFYANDEKTATLSEQQLIELLGEPEEIEDWNYEGISKSYPIHTLYYENGTYAYHFNAEMIQRISIDDVEIPYTNKEKIPEMFGLKNYRNTFVSANTGVSYRVQNCGVNDLWIAMMDEDSLDSIRISYGTIFEN